MKPSTIAELLPRDTPASYSESELRELERRVRNLALFDQVNVRVSGRVLHIDVRRKVPIEPELDFSTGATLKDTALWGGVQHHDVDGRASTFAIGNGYGERFAQQWIAFIEHTYRARKLAFEAIGYYTGSEVRFAGSPTSWVRGRLGGELELKLPYWYATPMHVHLALNSYGERSVFGVGGRAPASGVFLAPTAEIYWDRWTFNDLVPHGLVCMLRLAPGIFVGPNRPRHNARFDCLAAVPLSTMTVLAARGVLDGVNGGDPNHSVLIGSQEGVRGIADTLFRNRRQAFANVELRHAIDLGKRWYLQPVAFFDAARFEPMDITGTAVGWRSAVSAGAGVRLLPTALIDTLLRVDVARRLVPTGAWFMQVGIDQYF